MTNDRLLEEPSSEDAPTKTNGASNQGPRDAKGWDGKLRVERKAAPPAKSDADSDLSHSEEDTMPGESIEADEGKAQPFTSRISCMSSDKNVIRFAG